MRKYIRPSLINIGLVFGSIFICFGLLELGLRIIGYTPNYADATLYRATDDLRRYEHTPGWTGLFAGVSVRINTLGLRGAEIAREKVSQERRILIIGDSVAFGYAVQEPDIFATQLELIIQKFEPRQTIRVLNAGVAGYNTSSELEALRVFRKLKPDLVLVIYLVDNDSDLETGIKVDLRNGLIIHPGVNRTYLGKVSYTLHRYSRAYNFIRLRLSLILSSMHHIDVMEMDNFEETNIGWQRSRAALIEMRRLADADGIPFVVGGMALVQRLQGINALASFCKQEGLDYIELWRTKDLKSYLNSYAVSTGDGHPGPILHHMIANRLAAKLLPLLKD